MIRDQRYRENDEVNDPDSLETSSVNLYLFGALPDYIEVDPDDPGGQAD